MAQVVILGAGIAGHTAAMFCRKYLGNEHKVVVVTPNSQWNWIPSNIWVGVGFMKPEDVVFPLKPVYDKLGIDYYQAAATSLHPEGDESTPSAFVTIEYTSSNQVGQIEKLNYDYLINATGPKLKFEATAGLGPHGGNTVSVCTFGHAEEANRQLSELVERMKKGEKKRFVIGTGHGTCTCQGAALEYILNVDHRLRQEGVRDRAEIHWLSNEYEMGDLGVGGLHIKKGGYVTNSKIFTESLFKERGLSWQTRSHVQKVDESKIYFETLEGQEGETGFDFSMLIPPFSGVGLKAYDKSGKDITELLFAPNGFLKVDADYSKKPFEEWSPEDWPSDYQNPHYKNIFAAGIAFAPPHAISKPMTSVKGTPISPTPPRTGMPSAMIGKAVAISITNMIKGRENPIHKASMAQMGAACVASAGAGFFSGSAASMTMYPIIHDFKKYPEYGRSIKYTFGEIGTAGHWIKHILHHMFLYKAKAKPFWFMIPE